MADVWQPLSLFLSPLLVRGYQLLLLFAGAHGLLLVDKNSQSTDVFKLLVVVLLLAPLLRAVAAVAEDLLLICDDASIKFSL